MTINADPLKVLVIPSNPDRAGPVLALAARQVNAPRLQLSQANSLSQALTASLQGSLDLVVLDLTGVRPAGMEALEELVELGLPVLALTSSENDAAPEGVVDSLPANPASAPVLARLLRWLAYARLGQTSTALLRRFPDAWLLIDTDGQILQSSGASIQIMGAPTGKLQPRSLFNTVHPEDAPDLRRLLEQVLQAPDHVQRLRMRFRSPIGQWRWIAASARRLAHGADAPIIFAFRDVSDRMRAEQELEQFFSTVQQMADQAVIADRQGIIQYVNPAFEKQTGYSLAEAVGHKTNLLRSGQHASDFYHKLWGTIIAGQVYRGVLVNRKKSGELYYEDKTITPLTDGAGVITHFISTGRDITARMQAEYTLLESEQRFRTISELTSDYIYSVAIGPDQQFKVEWATEAFSQLTGYTSAGLAGPESLERLVHPDDAALYQQRRQRLLAGETDVSEYRLITRNGDLRWVREYGRPEINQTTGKVERFLAATQDISERKQAEAAVAQLAAIVASSDDAIFSLTNEGIIASWNAAAEQIFGFSATEIIGQPAASLCPPDRQAELARDLERLRRGERIPYHLTIRRNKEGRRLQMWMSSFSIRDAAGQVTGSAAISRDVSV